MVTHKFDGGFSTQIIACTATPQANEVATSAGNLTEQLGSISANAISARASAETAKAYAEEAKETTDIIKDYAEQAGETVEEILDDALSAGQSAEEAKESAQQAYDSASVAISQLSVVENIVGVLDLLATKGNYDHTDDTSRQSDKWYFIRKGSGTTEDPYEYEVATNPVFEYRLTEDASVVQGKPYYTRSGSGTEEDPYDYTLVDNPVDADLDTYYENSGWNYYELTGIQESIQNYVSSHLALVGNSLFLQTSEGRTSTRLELNTQQGMKMYDTNGNVVATYGNNVVIGDPSKFHVQVTNDRLSFFRDSVHEIAYMSGEKLYITQTVVLQQMDVGRPIGEVDTVTGEVGKGQWSWKVHEIDGVNNLYLKWIG